MVELPGEPYGGQIAPVYVDAFEQPGRLLYRFDAVLRNRGGTLDLYRDAASGGAMQAVWEGGVPSVVPDPNQPPSGAGASLIALDGASFDYVFEKTHDHWHFFSAARYELEGAGRVSDKVGFCLFDGFGDAGGDPLYFPPDYRGSGTQTWCGFDHPHGSFVRMGLSPGAADRYASQREFQWIDIAGLRPGRYVLRATANPDGSIVESAVGNNVVRVARVVPGVVAAAATVARGDGAGVDIGLSGAVVAPNIPARRAASCEPVAGSESCYVRASAGGPLSFRITRPPRHGTVALGAANGLRVGAHYTPASGYEGGDSFEYTATDARGLQSPPALVTINPPAAPPPPPPPPSPTGDTPPPVAGPPPPDAATEPARRRRVVAGLALRQRGDRWLAVVRLRTPARVSGRLMRLGARRTRPARLVPLDARRGRPAAARARLVRLGARPARLVRTIRPRRLSAGRRRIALGRLEGGRYRLRLRFAAGDGRRATVARRFRVP